MKLASYFSPFVGRTYYLKSGFAFVKLQEFCLVGYNALYFVENQLTFRRNKSPPSLGLKTKPNKQETNVKQVARRAGFIIQP
jgi:hypothetical protein